VRFACTGHDKSTHDVGIQAFPNSAVMPIYFSFRQFTKPRFFTVLDSKKEEKTALCTRCFYADQYLSG
jgi:hypothetical protein